jgi:outer membrane protein assembly factor BamB
VSVAIKTCPLCGQANPALSGFCPNCGTSIADVVPAVKAASAAQTFFAIPACLIPTRKKRDRYADDGAGSGMVWIGFFMVVIPILVSRSSPLAIITWVGGLLVIIGGFWRMRHNRHSFARAGLITSVLALAALGGVATKLASTRDAGLNEGLPAAETTARATTTPDWLAATGTAEVPAVAMNGSVPMFRGSAAHTGENPGPDPEGHPFRKWRFDSGGEIRSSAAIADGMVYFGSKDGYLYAIDVTTGRMRWQFDLGGYPVRSSPAVANRTVFAGGGYTLYAIDAESGQERWRFEMRYVGESSPTVADGVVYIASKESLVYAVDADTGKERWHIATEGLIFSSPAVANGLVFVGSDDGNLYAINAKTGQMKWKFATGGEVYSSPAVADDRVYVTSRSRSTFAVGISTGKEIWHYPVGGDSSPAVAGGTIYVGGDDGGLYALDADRGSLNWLFPTGRAIASSPVVTGGTVYLASGQTLYAIDTSSGEERWHYPATDEIGTSPAVVDGVIYVGAKDGYLYALAGDGVSEATPASQ